MRTHGRTAQSHVTAWFHGAGYAYKEAAAARTCLPSAEGDPLDCYDVRIVPAIERISHSIGYTEGGQELTITGTSLNGTATTVEVEGVECKLT